MKKIFVFAVALFSAAILFGQERTDNSFAFKYSPFQLVMGEINFGFEHRLSDHFSVEAEFGPTFSEMGILQVPTHGGPEDDGANYKESAASLFGSLAIRYYPLNYADAIRGLYISPAVKFRNYKTTFVDGQRVLPDKTGVKQQIMFRFITGFQFWLTENFGMDTFFGLGIGPTTVTEYITVNDYDFETNEYDYHWEETKGKKVLLNATFGFKFSIGN